MANVVYERLSHSIANVKTALNNIIPRFLNTTIGNDCIVETGSDGKIKGFIPSVSQVNPLPVAVTPSKGDWQKGLAKADHVHPNTCPDLTPASLDNEIANKGYVDAGKTSATLGREEERGTTDILLTTNVLTKIKYPDLIYKYGDIEIDTDTNKYGFKVKSAGTYVLSFFGLYSANVNDPVVEASVYKTNAANPAGIITHIRSGGKLGASGDLRTGGASSVLVLEVDDIVDVRVISTTTCTLSHKGMGFSIVKISSNA